MYFTRMSFSSLSISFFFSISSNYLESRKLLLFFSICTRSIFSAFTFAPSFMSIPWFFVDSSSVAQAVDRFYQFLCAVRISFKFNHIYPVNGRLANSMEHVKKNETAAASTKSRSTSIANDKGNSPSYVDPPQLTHVMTTNRINANKMGLNSKYKFRQPFQAYERNRQKCGGLSFE